MEEKMKRTKAKAKAKPSAKRHKAETVLRPMPRRERDMIMRDLRFLFADN
jgi:hypothetical protein